MHNTRNVIGVEDTMTYEVTWNIFNARCQTLAKSISEEVAAVYGIPTGGCFVAQYLSDFLEIPCLDSVGHWAKDRLLIVDDLIATGTTILPYIDAGYQVAVLFRKPTSPKIYVGAVEVDDWIKFPWEHTGRPEDAVIRLLDFLGDDPMREGLKDTPRRVCESLKEMTGGHQLEPKQVLGTTFKQDCDEMVVLRGIEFHSLCEHHLLPFSGEAIVGYIPDDRVVGISKLARLVDCFARRLQIQERMTIQIVDAIMENLMPKGAACIIAAHHQCMGCRGVCKPNTEMITSCLRGAIKEDPRARAEFLSFRE